MDEDELLYREMNPEDDFYMGPSNERSRYRNDDSYYDEEDDDYFDEEDDDLYDEENEDDRDYDEDDVDLNYDESNDDRNRLNNRTGAANVAAYRNQQNYNGGNGCMIVVALLIVTTVCVLI